MADYPEYKPMVAAAPFQAPDVQTAKMSVANKLMGFGKLAGKIKVAVDKKQLEGEKAQALVTLRENAERIRGYTLDNPGLNMRAEGNKRWNAWFKGYSQTVSKEARPYVFNHGSYYGLKMDSVFGTRERDLRKNILQENFGEYYDTSLRDVSNQSYDNTPALKNGKVVLDKKGNPLPMAAQTIGQIDNKIDMRVSVGDMPGRMGAAYKEKARDTAVENSHLGQFSRVLAAGDEEKKKKFLEDFEKTPSLSRQQKESLAGKFKRMEVAALNHQGIGKASAKEDHQGFVFGVRKGTEDPNSAKGIQIKERASQLGIDTSTWDDEVKEADAEAQVELAIRWMTPLQMDNVIGEFAPKEGDTAKILARKSKIYPASLSLKEELLKKRKANPAGYIQESQAFVATMEHRGLAAIDKSGNRVQGTQPNPVKAAQVSKLLQIRVCGATTGLPMKGQPVVEQLSRDAAASAASDINSQPLSEQGGAYTNFLNTFKDPSVRDTVAQDLQRAGVSKNAITHSNLATDPKTAPYQMDYQIAISKPFDEYDKVLAANKVPKSGINSLEDKIYKNKRFGNFVNSISAYNGDAATPINDMVNNVKLLAAQKIATGTAPDDAVKLGVNVFTNRQVYSSYNGKQFFFPDDISENRLKAAIRVKENEITPIEKDMHIPAETLQNLTPEERERFGKDLVVASSYWQSHPGQKVLVMVDSNGTPVKVDKKPVEISYDELRKKGSKINKAVNNQFAKEQTAFYEGLKLPTKQPSDFLKDNLNRILETTPAFVEKAPSVDIPGVAFAKETLTAIKHPIQAVEKFRGKIGEIKE